MLKKMIVVLAVLLMANTVFGAWSANRFMNYNGADPNTYADGMALNNPSGYKEVAGTPGFRTVDWEADGNNRQRKGESWNWPAQYEFVPITDIRVQMDVGFWVKINDCSTNKIIKLQQRMINQYSGSVTCSAATNVDTEWTGKFMMRDKLPSGEALVLGNKTGFDGRPNYPNNEVSVDPQFLPATKGSSKNITIRLKLWDVDLSKLPAGTNCLDIGVVRVMVRPNVRPNNFFSGCGGAYPVYAPPKVGETNQTPVWW